MHTVSADQALEKLKQGNQRNTTGRVEAAVKALRSGLIEI